MSNKPMVIHETLLENIEHRRAMRENQGSNFQLHISTFLLSFSKHKFISEQNLRNFSVSNYFFIQFEIRQSLQFLLAKNKRICE